MPEKVMPGPVEDASGIREAVCIHTRKIYDSCRDKDCIEDLRFYPKLQYVDVINRALSVKGGCAHLLYANWLNYYVYQETPFRIEDIQQLGDLR